MASPRILIVGGGIGGLTLAAALLHRGITADLIERAPEWAPVGAGITLGVNATRILDELGLLQAALPRAHRLSTSAIMNASGDALMQVDLDEQLRPWGVSLGIHRAELHDVLLRGVDESAIRTGTTVRSLEPGESISVEFADGSRDDYDLVVGADGIGSQVREFVAPNASRRYSGYACWRVVVQARLDPLQTVEMWGSGKRFGIVPLAGEQVYSFATINTPAGRADLESIDNQDFRRLFKEFKGPAKTVLDVVTPETKLIYGELEEVRLPRWSRARIVLIGDAAHAMTPNLGQGAAMAMEDAMALADEIGKGPLNEALTRWERRRRPRVESIQRVSWRQGQAGQLENPIGRFARDLTVRLTPVSVSVAGAKRLLLKEY